MNKLRIVRPLILGMIISFLGLMVGSSDLRNAITINGLGLNNYLVIFNIIIFVGLFFAFNKAIVIRTINISQFKFALAGVLIGGFLMWVFSFWEVSRIIFFTAPYSIVRFLFGFTELYHVAPELTNLAVIPFIAASIVYGLFGFITKYLYDLTSKLRPSVRRIISSLPFLLIIMITLFNIVSIILGGGGH